MYTQLFKTKSSLSLASMYKIKSNWQRDVEKFTVNTKARLKPKFFLTVCICGCGYSIIQYEIN